MNPHSLFSSIFRNSRCSRSRVRRPNALRTFTRPRLEELEDRRMLSVSPLGYDDLFAFPAEIAPAVTLNSGTLQITGTDTGDWVEIEDAGGTITVQIYDSRGETLLAAYPYSKAGVSQITFYGNAGDDTFKNWSRSAGTCSIPCYAYGGAGNDYLQGGSGANTLDGNDGNNMIVGGRGVNLFYNTGMGSSAFIWCGTADSWAAGSSGTSAGSDDAHLYFYATDRLKGNNYTYGGLNYAYQTWTDDNIFSAIDAVSDIYGLFGNYQFATSGNYADNAVYFCFAQQPASNLLGLNISNRCILLNDTTDADTIIHELAHNWNYFSYDYNDNGTQIYDDFFKISWYSATSLKSGSHSVHDFAPHFVNSTPFNVYGTSSASEDWATAVSYTLRGQFPSTPSGVWHEKAELVWDFVFYINPQHEARSVVVTTELDIIDANDGLISLREAILYAGETVGMTVTFDQSLRGKTITLDGKAMLVGKNITVDAAGMDITLDAAGRSGVLETNAAAVTLIGLNFTGGTGVYAMDTKGSLTLDRCTVYNNTSTTATLRNWPYSTYSDTGYIYYDCEVNVLNCLIYDNTTGSNGAISANTTGTVNIINSVIAANTGFAMTLNNTDAVILNSTIAANGPLGGFGTVYFGANGKTLTIINSIIAENASTYDLQLVKDTTGTIDIRYSLIGARSANTVYTADEHSLVGTSSSRAVPQFIAVSPTGTWAEQDLRLAETSPARGTGSVALAAGITTDILGNPRTSRGVIDMGAWQSEQPSPLPDEPTGVAATTAAGRITFSWAPVAGADYYVMQYHNGDGVWRDADVTGTSAVLMDLTDGTTYTIRLCSVNTTGQSEWTTTSVTAAEKLSLRGVLTTQLSGEATPPVSVTDIHEWQPFFLELWTPDGEFHRELVVEYDANLFTIPASGAVTADGIRLEFTDFGLNEATGTATFRVILHEDGVPVNPQAGQSLRLAAIYFMPTTEAVTAVAPGVAVEDIYRHAAAKSWLTVGGENIATNVWAVPYDLNDSGEVDIYDLIQFAKVYDGDAGKNPTSDFNGDREINIYDLILFAKQFGATWKTGAGIAVPRMEAAMAEVSPAISPAFSAETPARVAYYDTGLLYWVPAEEERKETASAGVQPAVADYLFEAAEAEEETIAAPMFQAFTASGVFRRKWE